MNPWSLLRREELRCCPQCGAPQPVETAPCALCAYRCEAPPAWPAWGFWGLVLGALGMSTLLLRAPWWEARP